MSLFGKRNTETGPLRPADTEASERVLATLERADLDPRQVILVGSAALALYGAELYSETGEPRPGDVDFLSTAANAEQLYRSRSTTIKDNVNNGRQTVLRLDDTGPLPIDIITAPQSAVETNSYDQRILKRIQMSLPIEGLGYRIIPLPDIIKAKKFEASGDPKAANDLASARNALANILRRQ